MTTQNLTTEKQESINELKFIETMRIRMNNCLYPKTYPKRYRKTCSYYNCDNIPTVKVMVKGIVCSVCFDHCVQAQRFVNPLVNIK